MMAIIWLVVLKNCVGWTDAPKGLAFLRTSEKVNALTQMIQISVPMLMLSGCIVICDACGFTLFYKMYVHVYNRELCI